MEEHGQLKTLNSCIVDTFRAVPETEFDLQTDMLKTYIQNSVCKITRMASKILLIIDI